MGKMYEHKLETIDSFRIFGKSFFAHSLTKILNKHNIKETSSKGNIWVPFYIPKGEGLGSSLKNKKILCGKIIYILNLTQ